MASNVLLVLWNGGWAERVRQSSIDASWRQENLLGLGALQSLDEVNRWADDQLDIFADERYQVTAQHDVSTDDDCPFIAYDVCDTISVPSTTLDVMIDEEVVAITIEEDDNGNIIATPELHDVVLGRQEAFAQQVKKLVDGALGGHSVVATPAAQVSTATGPECCPPGVPVGY